MEAFFLRTTVQSPHQTFAHVTTVQSQCDLSARPPACSGNFIYPIPSLIHKLDLQAVWLPLRAFDNSPSFRPRSEIKARRAINGRDDVQYKDRHVHNGYRIENATCRSALALLSSFILFTNTTTTSSLQVENPK
jgi:hypothetical protein